MTLAYVQGVALLVTFLIVSWAGLIIAMALLLPPQTARAELSLTESPLRSFFIGIGMLIPSSIALGMLRLPSGGAKLIGFVALVAIGAALAIGASGIAQLMGRRISELSDMRTGFYGLIRGSLVYSLALGFPLIGWFLFLPVSLVLALGAGTRALCRSNSQAIIPPASPGGPQYDLERRGAL